VKVLLNGTRERTAGKCIVFMMSILPPDPLHSFLLPPLPPRSRAEWIAAAPIFVCWGPVDSINVMLVVSLCLSAHHQLRLPHLKSGHAILI